MLRFADDSLKADRRFMLKAMKINSFALHYASKELQQDEELRTLQG